MQPYNDCEHDFEIQSKEKLELPDSLNAEDTNDKRTLFLLKVECKNCGTKSSYYRGESSGGENDND